MRIDADALVHGDVVGQRLDVRRPHQDQKTGATEPALTADNVTKVLEHLERAQRHTGKRLVRIMLPHEGAGAAGRARGDAVSLEQHDATGMPARELPRNAGSGAPTADDDHIRSIRHARALLP
jgi:hypothetical protein